MTADVAADPYAALAAWRVAEVAEYASEAASVKAFNEQAPNWLALHEIDYENSYVTDRARVAVLRAFTAAGLPAGAQLFDYLSYMHGATVDIEAIIRATLDDPRAAPR